MIPIICKIYFYSKSLLQIKLIEVCDNNRLLKIDNKILKQ